MFLVENDRAFFDRADRQRVGELVGQLREVDLTRAAEPNVSGFIRCAK